MVEIMNELRKQWSVWGGGWTGDVSVSIHCINQLVVTCCLEVCKAFSVSEVHWLVFGTLLSWVALKLRIVGEDVACQKLVVMSREVW